jgi:signal transduction histidine kinase
MGAPLLLLYAGGHLELLVFAAFGGFTSLYGRNEPYAVRAAMLAAAGAFLVLSVAIGSVTAALTDQVWVTVPVVAVFAGMAKLLANALTRRAAARADARLRDRRLRGAAVAHRFDRARRRHGRGGCRLVLEQSAASTDERLRLARELALAPSSMRARTTPPPVSPGRRTYPRRAS